MLLTRCNVMLLPRNSRGSFGYCAALRARLQSVRTRPAKGNIHACMHKLYCVILPFIDKETFTHAPTESLNKREKCSTNTSSVRIRWLKYTREKSFYLSCDKY